MSPKNDKTKNTQLRDLINVEQLEEQRKTAREERKARNKARYDRMLKRRAANG